MTDQLHEEAESGKETLENTWHHDLEKPYEEEQDHQPNAEDQHPYEEDQQPYEEEQQPYDEGQPNAEDQQPYEDDQPNAEDQHPYEEDQQLYGEDQPNAEDHQPYGDEYQQPCEVVEEDEPEQPNEGDRKYEEVPYRGDPGVEFTHETVLRQPGTAASRARSLGPRERIPLVRGKVDAIRNMFESEPDASSPTSEPSQGAVRFDSGAVGCGNAALMPLSHLSEHVEADSAVVDPHHGPVLVVDPQQHYYFHGDENLDETEGHLQPVGLETSSQFYDPLYLDTGDDDSVSVVLKTPEEQPHFPDKPNTAPRASDASDRNALSIRSSPFVETLKAEPINADPIDTVAVDAPNPLHQLFMPVERVQPVSSSGTLQYSPTSDRDLAVSPTLLPKVRQRGAGELNDESKGLPRLSSPVSWPQVPYGAGMIPRQQPTPPAKPRYRKSVHELGGNQNRQPPHGEQSARGARVNEGDRVPQREQSALRGARVGEGELVPLREQPALRGTRANEGDRVPQREQSALRGARVDEGELARAQPAPRGSRVNEGDRVPQREQMSVGGAQNFKTTGQPVQKDRWEPRGVDTLKTDRQTSTMDKNAASKERLANPAARPTSGRGGSVERSVQTELTAEDLQAMRSGPTAKEPVRDLATRFAPRGDILFEDAQGNQAVANSGDRSAVSISDLLEQALNTKNPEVVNLRASFARRPSPLAARFVPPIRRESPQPTRHPDHTVVKHALPPQAALGKENVSDEESVRLRHTTQPNCGVITPQHLDMPHMGPHRDMPTQIRPHLGMPPKGLLLDIFP
ncbi:MAG: uncharacterized protein KVP18_004339 [Porospora cf. gigantea A]|uniref:uncharacterized protein n=1 Tax=Porospora cf. gigantea A TaxID=2853593 RepID=UPI0035598D51|nr:MAG: hypothetical protein KVP18_004339 [Porospora cf. gigantea A]